MMDYTIQKNNKERLGYMTNWNGPYQSWTETGGKNHGHGKLSPAPLSKQLVIILTVKANKMHFLSSLFGKELYTFQTDLLSIIRSFNTVYTAIGICHAGYVGCLTWTLRT
jgi:hypothetical protein